MAAVPGTPRTWVAGEYVTAAQMNAEVRDSLSFLRNPPACRVFHNAVQPVANNGGILSFNSERFDTAAMHDTATNNSRITFATAGLYIVGGNIQFASSSAGLRGVAIRLNGTDDIAYDLGDIDSASSHRWAISTTYKFAAADYVELFAFQSTGASLDVVYVGPTHKYSPEFYATWVGVG